MPDRYIQEEKVDMISTICNIHRISAAEDIVFPCNTLADSLSKKAFSLLIDLKQLSTVIRFPPSMAFFSD